MNDDIAKLRAKLQQLKTLLDSGTLSPQAYEAGKAQLERQLLDRVMADPDSTGAGTAATPSTGGARPSTRMVVLLGLAVVVLAVAGYSRTGSPALITGPMPAQVAEGGEAASPHDLSGEQFATAVDKLADKLKDEPQNYEGWAMLARSYTRLGKVAQAVAAYKQAAAIKGDDAKLLADYADALAVSNNRSLEGEPLKLIERALKIEPDNLKALALAGTAAFDRKDYKGAVRYWEKVAAVAPADEEFRKQVQASIDEARQLAGMPASAKAEPGPAQVAAPSAATNPAGANGGAVRGTVRLAPALARQASPTDTVFVFARAPEGSHAPLAIVRLQVKDLPAQFSLDDSMAMSPEMKLSRLPKVVVAARISKSGQAVPAPGDLAGQSAAVAPGSEGLVVEINEVVKN